MKNMLRTFCLLLLALLVNTQGLALDLTPPTAIRDIVYAAYKNNDFATIDAVATQLRTEKGRTPSGAWTITLFYNSLYGAIRAGRGRESSTAEWSETENKLNRWIASSPLSVTAPIALGYAQRWQAWALRGTGFANTVSDKGWKDFAKQLAISHRTLMVNKKISSVDPQWYVEMLEQAQAENWKRAAFMALYEEAITKEPLYHETHIVAMERFLPMWGGSVGEMQEFATQAVLRTSAKEGNALYAYLYTHAENRMAEGEFYKDPYLSSLWNQTVAGYEDLIKQYPTDWNRNHYAKIACMVGVMNTFKVVARQFNGKPDKDAWPGNRYEVCKNHLNKIRPEDPLL
jgi:hypothetical protein